MGKCLWLLAVYLRSQMDLSAKNIQRIKGFAIYFGIACIGFSVNVISRIIYSDVLKLRFSISVALAYFTAMIVGFTLTKMFAFGARDSGNTMREAVKFFVVSMVALFVTLIMSVAALIINNWLFEAYPDFHAEVLNTLKGTYRFINRELASHLFGIGFGFFANYFGHKFVTFKTTGYWDRMIDAKESWLSKRA